MEKSRTEWEDELLSKQPAFNTKEEAIKEALKKLKSERIYEIWQDPYENRFLVCHPQSFETLYRRGYEKVLGTGDLVDRMDHEEIEEV